MVVERTRSAYQPCHHSSALPKLLCSSARAWSPPPPPPNRLGLLEPRTAHPSTGQCPGSLQLKEPRQRGRGGKRGGVSPQPLRARLEHVTGATTVKAPESAGACPPPELVDDASTGGHRRRWLLAQQQRGAHRFPGASAGPPLRTVSCSTAGHGRRHRPRCNTAAHNPAIAFFAFGYSALGTVRTVQCTEDLSKRCR